MIFRPVICQSKYYLYPDEISICARFAGHRPQRPCRRLSPHTHPLQTTLLLRYSPSHPGYLDFDTASFHYVFFDSQRDPDNDPVIVWLNGGPGCSSLLGMSYENGPFVFKEGTVTFELNPYAWNVKANLLYIESPGGVGFSTSKRDLKHNDSSVAIDNYKALLQFFNKFPTLKKNDFYLTG